MAFDPSIARRVSDDVWAGTILPTLEEYITIPNESPAFDPHWDEHGHMARAVALLREWCASRPIDGITIEVVQLPGRTPVLLVEVPAHGDGAGGAGADPDDTVLLYGHLDKQPPMEGWRDGLGPWSPVVDGDRLYGRGGADDGYSVFAALTAIEAVREAGGAHTRCVVLIEATEESGSPDLPAYVEHLLPRLGAVSLVVTLDSGCADYERLWVTTSLRGLIDATLRVDVLEVGVHSGMSGGAPDSFRIARSLLSRVEDETTGRILLDALHAAVPAERAEQITAAAAAIGGEPGDDIPLVPGARPMAGSVADLITQRTWEPSLTVIGASGLPEVGKAGNVLRAATTLGLSFRLPPTVDAKAAAAALGAALEADPPYGARVVFTANQAESGWDAPATAPWLTAAFDAASAETFGAPARAIGIGGSIPFMAMLGARFPAAQFAVIGVLGPGSNAHGPNEFLHLPTARHLTAGVARLLDAHARRGATAS